MKEQSRVHPGGYSSSSNIRFVEEVGGAKALCSGMGVVGSIYHLLFCDSHSSILTSVVF